MSHLHALVISAKEPLMPAAACVPNLVGRFARVALASLLLTIASTIPALAQSNPASRHQRSDAAVNRQITLGVGKSLAIDLPRDARDVIVANPAIANAVVRSARRVFLIGVAVGQTNVFFLDAQGQQIAGYDIEISRDLAALRLALRSLAPG